MRLSQDVSASSYNIFILLCSDRLMVLDGVIAFDDLGKFVLNLLERFKLVDMKPVVEQCSRRQGYEWRQGIEPWRLLENLVAIANND